MNIEYSSFSPSNNFSSEIGSLFIVLRLGYDDPIPSCVVNSWIDYDVNSKT